MLEPFICPYGAIYRSRRKCDVTWTNTRLPPPVCSKLSTGTPTRGFSQSSARNTNLCSMSFGADALAEQSRSRIAQRNPELLTTPHTPIVLLRYQYRKYWGPSHTANPGIWLLLPIGCTPTPRLYHHYYTNAHTCRLFMSSFCSMPQRHLTTARPDQCKPSLQKTAYRTRRQPMMRQLEHLPRIRHPSGSPECGQHRPKGALAITNTVGASDATCSNMQICRTVLIGGLRVDPNTAWPHSGRLYQCLGPSSSGLRTWPIQRLLGSPEIPRLHPTLQKPRRSGHNSRRRAHTVRSR